MAGFPGYDDLDKASNKDCILIYDYESKTHRKITIEHLQTSLGSLEGPRGFPGPKGSPGQPGPPGKTIKVSSLEPVTEVQDSDTILIVDESTQTSKKASINTLRGLVMRGFEVRADFPANADKGRVIVHTGLDNHAFYLHDDSGDSTVKGKWRRFPIETEGDLDDIMKSDGNGGIKYSTDLDAGIL